MKNIKKELQFIIGTTLFVEGLSSYARDLIAPDNTIDALKKLKHRELTTKDVYLHKIDTLCEAALGLSLILKSVNLK